MKKYLVLLVAVAVAACSQSDTQTPQEEILKQEKQSTIPDHFYSLQDGQEYGYESAISQDQANAGQAASNIIMIRFAGEKDGKYQIYGKENQVYSVFECDKNCQFIKSMVFVDNQLIRKEMLKGGNDSVASFAFMDAINGKLEKSVEESKGKKYHIWFTEKGKQRTEIK
ncbi:hypothetical protein [Neisseria musculi]|uniref:Lipoprotein n=1 Tax=Neisseria musculi TaxID=1815583 RepID=A0A7H1MF30_9NEIS|nr:hypothetical protein [Neisseria musculi]QNT60245.1 putative lipoprotein [Neisseria musculi]